MLCWSRRRRQRTTRAADRWTISSRCSRVPVTPYRAAFPKSSRDVTRACTSVLHALNGKDDRIRAMPRSWAWSAYLGTKRRMKLYIRKRVFLHVCFIMKMTNHTYSAVLGLYLANTITTFVHNIWTYIWYQIIANKHLFHIKLGNLYNTAIKYF